MPNTTQIFTGTIHAINPGPVVQKFGPDAVPLPGDPTINISVTLDNGVLNGQNNLMLTVPGDTSVAYRGQISVTVDLSLAGTPAPLA